MTRFSVLAFLMAVSFLVGGTVAFSPQQQRPTATLSLLRVLNGIEIEEEKAGPTSKTFFDVEEEHEGEVCLLADPEQLSVIKETGEEEQRFWITVHRVVRLVPIVAPIMAYFSYEELASSVNLIEGE